MVDYENLVSPGGGSNYGERSMGSGLLAGVGIGLVQHKISSKEFKRSALKRLGGANFTSTIKSDSKFVRAGIVRGRTQGAGISGLNRLQERAAFHSMGAPLSEGGYGPRLRRGISINQQKVDLAMNRITSNTALRKTEISALKSRVRNTTAEIAAHGSRLKALGWASAIFDTFYMTSTLLAPGPSISAKAQASDMQAMLQPTQTSALMTQRQRSLQAIHDSQLAISPILGNEAAYMHR